MEELEVRQQKELEMLDVEFKRQLNEANIELNEANIELRQRRRAQPLIELMQLRIEYCKAHLIYLKSLHEQQRKILCDRHEAEKFAQRVSQMTTERESNSAKVD